MAGKAPAVSVEQADDGSITIGATIDGVFIPVASKHGGYVANVIKKANASGASSSAEEAEE